MSEGVLAGVRVVDLTSVVVGPVATMFLADHGADVIKVESPDGDMLRTLGGASLSGQLSPKFLHLNRNKRSITLDLKRPDGIKALRRLLGTAHVCVSNMRPAAMARLGLSVDNLRSLNPDLIYCGLVGFGRKGRYSGKPAYDGIIQGVGGLTGIFEAAGEVPRFVPMTIADHLVGLIAAQMIMLALYRRQTTGTVEPIEVPMFENMASFVLSEHLGQLTFDPPRGEPGDMRVLSAGARPIPTLDGHICISANTDAQAFALFDAIGRSDLRDDPRFRSIRARYENVDAYFALREEAMRQRTTGEWLAILDRLDVPAGPSHTLNSLFADDHLREAGLFQTRAHPDEGDIIDIALPNTAPGLARADYLPPPMNGQHTSEVLAEIGYTRQDIAAVLSSGAARMYSPVSASAAE